MNNAPIPTTEDIIKAGLVKSTTAAETIHSLMARKTDPASLPWGWPKTVKNFVYDEMPRFEQVLNAAAKIMADDGRAVGDVIGAGNGLSPKVYEVSIKNDNEITLIYDKVKGAYTIASPKAWWAEHAAIVDYDGADAEDFPYGRRIDIQQHIDSSVSISIGEVVAPRDMTFDDDKIVKRLNKAWREFNPLNENGLFVFTDVLCERYGFSRVPEPAIFIWNPPEHDTELDAIAPYEVVIGVGQKSAFLHIEPPLAIIEIASEVINHREKRVLKYPGGLKNYDDLPETRKR